jgi:hypothetical protein
MSAAAQEQNATLSPDGDRDTANALDADGTNPVPGGARPKDPNLPCPHSNQVRNPSTGRCRVRRGATGTPVKRATPMDQQQQRTLRRSSRIQRRRATPAASVTARRPRTVAQLAMAVDALNARVDRIDARIGTPTPSAASAESPGWGNLLAAAASYNRDAARGTSAIPTGIVQKRANEIQQRRRSSAKAADLDALLLSSESSRGGSVRRKHRRNSIRSPMRGEA